MGKLSLAANSCSLEMISSSLPLPIIPILLPNFHISEASQSKLRSFARLLQAKMFPSDKELLVTSGSTERGLLGLERFLDLPDLRFCPFFLLYLVNSESVAARQMSGSDSRSAKKVMIFFFFCLGLEG